MLTFLFTDIADHTVLWEAHPEAMSTALADCEQLLEAAITEFGGRVVKRDGDAVMAVFERPADAVAAVSAAQTELAQRRWPDIGELRVRMGMHVGDAEHRDDDYYGTTVIRAARLCGCASGGQVVASSAVVALTPDVVWTDLGEYRLRGLRQSEHIYQLGLQREKSFPPLRDVESTRERLPRPRTSFIGRVDEVEQGVALLSTKRVVTLTGVGGSGKTRLAIEIARVALKLFPDGVVFVDLGLVTDPAQVDAEFSTTLGFEASSRGAESLHARIRDYFRNRRALVVLDNCEHLLDDCAELADDLLEHCPDVAVLMTSREPLRVEGEHILQLPSLPRESAMELFRERSGVDIADDDLLGQVCERLDGMPLAIELAAARCRSLPLDQLARRLDDRFALLTGGRRRIQRQQTLQATLDWSFDLLEPAEQMLFPRLAVFAGPFTIEAVEAVCGRDLAMPIEALAALVDCNLVDYLPGIERYRLLETMRLYGEHRLLAAGELDALRDAHQHWFVDQVMSVPSDEAFLFGVSSRSRLPDLENVRAALRWAAQSDDWETIGRLVPQCVGLFVLVDPAEGTEWADRALEHLDDARLRFGCLAAWISLRLMQPIAERSFTEYSIRDQPRERYTELIDAVSGRDDGFAVYMQAAVAPDVYAGGLATGDDALCTVAKGLLRDALQRADRLQIEPVWHGLARVAAGLFALTTGDATAAVREYTLALQLLADTPAAEDSDLVAELALTMHLAGSPDTMVVARRALTGSPAAYGHMTAHCALALEYSGRGEVRAAATELERGSTVLDRVGGHVATQFLICAAVVALAGDDATRASSWLATAVGHGGIFSTPAGVTLYRTWIPRVRAALDHHTAAALRSEGRERTLHAATREAVEWSRRVGASS